MFMTTHNYSCLDPALDPAVMVSKISFHN